MTKKVLKKLLFLNVKIWEGQSFISSYYADPSLENRF